MMVLFIIKFFLDITAAEMLEGRSVVFSKRDRRGIIIKKKPKYAEATLEIRTYTPSAGIAPTQPNTRQSKMNSQ